MPNPSAPSRLLQWLTDLGLQSYEDAFVSNDVSFELLANITADDLRDIGIVSVGHRRILLQAIEALSAPIVQAGPVPSQHPYRATR